MKKKCSPETKKYVLSKAGPKPDAKKPKSKK